MIILSAYFREICDLADKYGAITLVDECHAAGILGQTGRLVTQDEPNTVHVHDFFVLPFVFVEEQRST